MVYLQVETKHIIPFKKRRISDPINTTLNLTGSKLRDTLKYLENNNIPYKILPVRKRKVQ